MVIIFIFKLTCYFLNQLLPVNFLLKKNLKTFDQYYTLEKKNNSY